MKKLISILSKNYIALCKSTEELQKTRTDDLKKFDAFQEALKKYDYEINE
ncbi:MAG: hypothetical protein AB1349_13700 [Elusimicrobiota bacterium]